MMWQVRALLHDRPGAMAALAAGCGQHNVNILGLQIFPAADGRVVDELVLHTPGGWSAAAVERLCVSAGVEGAAVAECSPHALEDQPVRYLRAARLLVEEPQLLVEQLCRVLDAAPADGATDEPTLLLDDGEGHPLRLSRTLPFTDTERARASELRSLAEVAARSRSRATVPKVPSTPDPPTPVRRVSPGAVVLRAGTAADAERVTAMHARCSEESVLQRYHAPLPRLSPRLARSLLEPTGGTSIVATVEDEVVALAVLAPGASHPEIGLLVEDRWQRKGVGARMLRALAVEAATRGATEMLGQVHPDNSAVLPTVRRAELMARVSSCDGLLQVTIPVAPPAGARRKPHNRPAMGRVTTPLVALLHARSELREVYPPADLIDQGVRGGA